MFDFDGVVLDTETPLFEAWRLAYRHFGVEPIGLAEWCESLGRADDDPLVLDPVARLRRAAGVDEAEVHRVRRSFSADLFAQMELGAGVASLLDQADAMGIGIAIASSSEIDWIERHLGPRGLLDRFEVISCAGGGVPGKPDPTVYERACAALDADPRACLALEDSPNGTFAAKAAGLRCIATRTPINQDLDLSHADRVVDSLEAVRLVEWFSA